MWGLRVSGVRVSLALCAAALAMTGFAACEEDGPDPVATQADRAIARMQQFVADQQRQLQQSAQARSYDQSATVYRDYLATQEQAELDLRALRSNQALAGFYAARARNAEEVTRIFREQMERQAELQRVYDQRRDLERLEQKRLDEQRYRKLYEEEQRRREQLEDPYE